MRRKIGARCLQGVSRVQVDRLIASRFDGSPAFSRLPGITVVSRQIVFDVGLDGPGVTIKIIPPNFLRAYSDPHSTVTSNEVYKSDNGTARAVVSAIHSGLSASSRSALSFDRRIRSQAPECSPCRSSLEWRHAPPLPETFDEQVDQVRCAEARRGHDRRCALGAGSGP